MNITEKYQPLYKQFINENNIVEKYKNQFASSEFPTLKSLLSSLDGDELIKTATVCPMNDNSFIIYHDSLFDCVRNLLLTQEDEINYLDYCDSFEAREIKHAGEHYGSFYEACESFAMEPGNDTFDEITDHFITWLKEQNKY